jgi:hypothetical protein
MYQAGTVLFFYFIADQDPDPAFSVDDPYQKPAFHRILSDTDPVGSEALAGSGSGKIIPDPDLSSSESEMKLK